MVFMILIIFISIEMYFLFFVKKIKHKTKLKIVPNKLKTLFCKAFGMVF